MAYNYAVYTVACDEEGVPFRRCNPVYASSPEEAILKAISFSSRPSDYPDLFEARLMSDSESVWRS